MKIEHEPEPLAYDAFIGVVLAPGGRQVAAVSPSTTRVGDCVLFSIAREAPHDCSVPGCPGPENKRRLEAFGKMVRICEAVLLFHRGGQWTEEDRNRWWNATQSEEATTKVLCDTIRAVLTDVFSVAIAKAEGK